jgi:ABC-type phosphate transport system substrate-binding protein
MAYTIGYADLSDTVDSSGKAKVSVAKLKNAAGQYLAPTSATSATFLQNFFSRKYFNATSGAVTIDFTKVVSNGYNMSLITYAIADKNASSATAGHVQAFITYLLNTCGPNFAASLGYAPIAGELKTKALALAAAIKP